MKDPSSLNIRIIFLAAAAAVIWGGYNICKVSYIALAWSRTEGVVVDFNRSVWSCGKGISECYALIAGYHVGDDYYTAISDRRFNNSRPAHLSGEKVVIYYSPSNPAEAVFGGDYGPKNGGITIFLIGAAVLTYFRWSKKNVFKAGG